MLFASLVSKMEQPDLGNVWILAPVILMVISIFLPCLIWFIRNFLRIVLNKNYEILNRSLKWIFLFGFIIFIISIIILSLVVSGVIKN
ncbi:MAG: hypothetical protein ACRDCD_02035 [Mycoplasmoidaceae bacterium]